jgi:hypothetical protein
MFSNNPLCCGAHAGADDACISHRAKIMRTSGLLSKNAETCSAVLPRSPATAKNTTLKNESYLNSYLEESTTFKLKSIFFSHV